MRHDTTDLDRLLPLTRGRHADVISLRVETPMRYSECVLGLADGTTARLKDRRALLGFTQSSSGRAFFFRHGRELIRMRVVPTRRGSRVRVDSWNGYASCAALSASDPAVSVLGDTHHRVVTPDGSLLFLAPLVTEQQPARPLSQLTGTARPAVSAVSL